METESGAQTSNQTQTDSLSPSPNPVSPVPLNNPTSAPRYGTVIPNRIFVGGIDFKEMATHSTVLAWRIPRTGSLVGCRLWGDTESDTTEAT
uniref:Uncharacterized protein n=1 Tax=Ovis aries TaxID=9940 RepID=A0AC11DCR2_SHEEP